MLGERTRRSAPKAPRGPRRVLGARFFHAGARFFHAGAWFFHAGARFFHAGAWFFHAGGPRGPRDVLRVCLPETIELSYVMPKYFVCVVHWTGAPSEY